MIKIYIDPSTSISKLISIKRKKLHNPNYVGSGFMEFIVPSKNKNIIHMAYVNDNSSLIGWVYLRKFPPLGNMAYDAGSFISEQYRKNRYATQAMSILIEHILNINKNKPIDIHASDTTYRIVERMNNPKVNAFWFNLYNCDHNYVTYDA
jgi:hypothetical protein